MPHVMFGGLAHEQALTLARRLAALLPGDLDRVFFSEFGLGRGRGRDEDGGAVLAQPRHAAARSKFVAFKGGYHGDTTGAMAVCDPDDGHARAVPRAAAGSIIVDLPRDEAERRGASTRLSSAMPTRLAGIIVEPLVQGAGGMRFHDAGGAAPPARGGRPLRACC